MDARAKGLGNSRIQASGTLRGKKTRADFPSAKVIREVSLFSLVEGGGGTTTTLSAREKCPR